MKGSFLDSPSKILVGDFKKSSMSIILTFQFFKVLSFSFPKVVFRFHIN